MVFRWFMCLPDFHVYHYSPTIVWKKVVVVFLFHKVGMWSPPLAPLCRTGNIYNFCLLISPIILWYTNIVSLCDSTLFVLSVEPHILKIGLQIRILGQWSYVFASGPCKFSDNNVKTQTMISFRPNHHESAKHMVLFEKFKTTKRLKCTWSYRRWIDSSLSHIYQSFQRNLENLEIWILSVQV